MMKRLFEGMVWVDYSQVYVVADPENLPDMDWCFEGQENGLCGASQPGVLFLITGLNTGSVAMTVDLCDSEPPLRTGYSSRRARPRATGTTG